MLKSLSDSQKKVVASIQSLPDQINQALREIKQLKLAKDYAQNTDKVVICGMGGSRFPGVILEGFFESELKKPVFICQDYFTPGWLDNKTLVILSSYSGTTEETISSLESASAKTDYLIGISTGGKLEEKMKELNRPFYKLNPVHNPSGQPRLAFGYSFGALAGLLEQINALKKGTTDNLLEEISFMKKIAEAFGQENSLPYQTAKQIERKMPIFVSAEFLKGLGNAVNNQINETAKSIADFHNIPELNHHLMEGLKNPKQFKDLAVFVFYYSDLYYSRIAKRFTITKEVVRQNHIPTIWLEAEGKNKAQQLFYFMMLSAFVSFYLSYLYQEDPSIIPFVDYFKKRLSE
ncbi:MAG: bifunctional phosphoglucose/phosphomannose isomerase [Patescibacteria group bacterium]|nr:MAG: bifunctional phosphoglucose/phosphomannose isomerase [Patescibacteria group bacterium]